MNLRISKQNVLRILAVSGVWVIIAALSAAQVSLIRMLRGDADIFGAMFTYELIIWQVWGLFVPIIWWLSKKYPLEKRILFRNLLWHITLSIVIVLLYIVVYVGYDRLFFEYYTQPKWTFWQCMIVFVASKFHWNFITYWGILGVVNAFEYQRKFRERALKAIQLESQLFQSQLQALKMQLHPHFLFNTLHTIASMVRQEEKKEAVAMLTGLSELLRMALEQGQKQRIPLKEEMDFVNTYLAIEQVRFKDRLQLDIQIEATTLDAIVPNLLLQPLVENAIRHGLAKKLSARQLQIRSYQKNEFLNIEVYNEGLSLPNDWHLNNSEGVGLSNTQKRLEQLYNGQHQLQIKNHQQGVLVSVQIPFEKASPEN